VEDLMNVESKGRLLTVEGVDGAGKTTNAVHLVEQLRERGYTVIHTREPGGTPVGEKMRALLLQEDICDLTEALMFAAIRSEHLDKLILPNLKAGNIVVSERFADSTYAYQGYARDNIPLVQQLEKMVCGDFEPHHTLFLHITEAESMKRVMRRSGGMDRIEKAGVKFHQDVYQGMQIRMMVHAHRVFIIDGMQELDDVKKSITKWIDEKFVPNNPL
jgi:dTMP kinase